MGFYIDPPYCSKEKWLANNAVRVLGDSYSYLKNPLYALVVLVDNGPFTAAGIAFSQREFEAFNDPNDKRPKCLFAVERKKLFEVFPEYKDIPWEFN